MATGKQAGEQDWKGGNRLNLIEWTDDDGIPHLSWLPTGADDPRQGIPHDPPEVDKLRLPEDQAQALYAALVKQRLVTWRSEIQLRAEAEQAVRRANGLTPTPKLVGQVMTLYSDRKVIKPLWTRLNLDRILDNFECGDEQRQCIKEIFGAAKIETLADVENAPARTGHICGIDIYQLVAHILAWA